MRCVPGVHYRERPLKLISPATLWEFPGIPGRPCDFSSSASRAGLRAGEQLPAGRGRPAPALPEGLGALALRRGAASLHRHRLKAA